MFNNRIRNDNRRRRGGNSRGGMKVANLPQRAPSAQGPVNLVKQPTLYPRIVVTRLIQSGTYDQINNGITATLAVINFSLNDVPGYTELTAMYQTYCIEQVELWFRPEYTELTDASALSNSVNVDFYSAIDLVDSSAPVNVDAVCEYQSCAHTSITKDHYRKIRPNYLIDGIAPACGLISTASPSTNWYGLKVAIPPCGVAMTFRAVAKFKIALVGLK